MFRVTHVSSIHIFILLRNLSCPVRFLDNINTRIQIVFVFVMSAFAILGRRTRDMCVCFHLSGLCSLRCVCVLSRWWMSGPAGVGRGLWRCHCDGRGPPEQWRYCCASHNLELNARTHTHALALWLLVRPPQRHQMPEVFGKLLTALTPYCSCSVWHSFLCHLNIS